MKRLFILLGCALLLLNACAINRVSPVSPDSPAYYPPDVQARLTCDIDATQTGKYINNKVRMTNYWSRYTFLADAENMSKEFLQENLPFLETIEIMTATGGNQEYDLFKDPLNYEVLDDYDFSHLITTCKKLIEFGVRPSIKLGNVPLKLTGKPLEGGHFNVTTLPPYDYNLYYDYIHAIAQALVDEFGKDTVASWRFGVLTEYDNAAWFYVPGETMTDHIANYCMLYDYTAAALQDVLGENICIGAHSEGASLVAQEFIKHCAVGTNYKTGQIGSPLKYLDISYYVPLPTSEVEYFYKVEGLREVAEQCGLTDLEYGVGEGRILFGGDGLPLEGRLSAKSAQAAFDATLYKYSIEQDVDYISTWPWFTLNGLAEGFPLINMHMASLFYKMVGSTTVSYETMGQPLGVCSIDGISSYDKEKQKLYIMTYDYSSRPNRKNDMAYNVKLPFESGSAKITKYVVGDDCNFYDEWLEDRIELGITTDDFGGWSSEESAPPRVAMINPEAIAKFNSKIPDYEKATVLTPTQDTISFNNSTLQLYHSYDVNTVVFYEIELTK